MSLFRLRSVHFLDGDFGIDGDFIIDNHFFLEKIIVQMIHVSVAYDIMVNSMFSKHNKINDFLVGLRDSGQYSY